MDDSLPVVGMANEFILEEIHIGTLVPLPHIVSMEDYGVHNPTPTLVSRGNLSSHKY